MGTWDSFSELLMELLGKESLLLLGDIGLDKCKPEITHGYLCYNVRRAFENETNRGKQSPEIERHNYNFWGTYVAP